jgi:hypothetical protein
MFKYLTTSNRFMIRLALVASLTLPMFLLVAGSSISQAEGQTVGKQLMDALQSGEGVVRQIEDGGVAVIDKIGSFFSGGDVENNVDKAREALSQGNNETAAAAIETVDETLQNSSGRISGLGQRVADIAENQTLPIDQATRQTLTEIGDALNSVAQDFDGVYQSNSSSS